VIYASNIKVSEREKHPLETWAIGSIEDRGVQDR